MDHDETAQIQADLMMVNHNFIRPHMGLHWKTPAQAAGVGLASKNKWMELLRLWRVVVWY